MTRDEAQRKLIELREKIHRDHDNVQNLLKEGRINEALDALKKIQIVDVQEVYNIALIAEGKELAS